jgi:hypothetical protein
VIKRDYDGGPQVAVTVEEAHGIVWQALDAHDPALPDGSAWVDSVQDGGSDRRQRVLILSVRHQSGIVEEFSITVRRESSLSGA